MPDRAGKTVVEVLYPEYANQAGDNGNAMYLRACLPDATFVETSHDDVPYFAEHVPSLVLLCGMSEAQQEKTIELLMPYRDRLNELVDAGVPMLFTGSAPEVLGSKIVNPDGSEVCGLGILDFVTHRNMPERYHDVVIGDFVPAPGQKPIKVVGFKIFLRVFLCPFGDKFLFKCAYKVGAAVITFFSVRHMKTENLCAE